SVTAVLGGALGFGAGALGAGVFATGGAVLFAACGCRVVTLGLDPAAGSGRDVADGGKVTAGCGVGDALVAGGGDGSICLRPAQAFSPRIAAAIIQICLADISCPPPSSGCRCPCSLASRLWFPSFRRRNLRTIPPLGAGASFFVAEPACCVS